MKDVVRKRREARQDLVEIFRYIVRKSGLRSARSFLTQAEATFQRLAGFPNSGTPFDPDEPRFAGLRYCPISRFRNYIAFYRPLPDGVEILRVLHGSRDIEGILAADADEEAPEAE